MTSQAASPDRRPCALVTGAAGFTGHHMVLHAARAGLRVRATDVSSRHYGALFDALGVEFVAADLTRREKLDRLLEGVDAVFHVAGIHDYSTPDEIIFAEVRPQQVPVVAAELLEKLQATGRVRLLVFGHVHQPYEDEHNGIQVIGTPSTCRQFKPGSDDFDVDERPPAYRRITLHADGSNDNELIWVDN